MKFMIPRIPTIPIGLWFFAQLLHAARYPCVILGRAICRATALGLYSILKQCDLELVFALLPLSTTASSGTILRSQTGRSKVEPL
ncbi:MAG: hypothetical protein JWM11_5413 [Planctomycetaceae bacterium]|nr:hypothetical protein [Planctomycetaceae bacterium]